MASHCCYETLVPSVSWPPAAAPHQEMPRASLSESQSKSKSDLRASCWQRTGQWSIMGLNGDRVPNVEKNRLSNTVNDGDTRLPEPSVSHFHSNSISETTVSGYRTMNREAGMASTHIILDMNGQWPRIQMSSRPSNQAGT